MIGVGDFVGGCDCVGDVCGVFYEEGVFGDWYCDVYDVGFLECVCFY